MVDSSGYGWNVHASIGLSGEVKLLICKIKCCQDVLKKAIECICNVIFGPIQGFLHGPFGRGGAK